MKKAILIQFMNGGHLYHIFRDEENWGWDNKCLNLKFLDIDGNTWSQWFPIRTIKEWSIVAGNFQLDDPAFLARQ